MTVPPHDCAKAHTLIRFSTGQMKVRYHTHKGSECVTVSAPVQAERPPVVRIHSACLFGEALGSLECDCKAQLEAALSFIASDGGALAYLFQEGRGIGLCSKIAAMELERTEGVSTVDAFRTLGYAADPRSYDVALSALRDLGIVGPVRAISNNPKKLDALRAGGFEIAERIEPTLVLTQTQAALVRAKQISLGQIPYSNIQLSASS